MTSRIAYIDDSSENLKCLATIFNKEFPFETYQDPDKFLGNFDQTSYGSILLDIHMPSISGFSLYEKIIRHQNYNGCPIIFISSDDSDCAKIKSHKQRNSTRRNAGPSEVENQVL
ncbi:MAG TPA: response regulator [Bacteriovoracaceae bacterium]|nr:response regulator [Bacteriovoracaceae bacterium]